MSILRQYIIGNKRVTEYSRDGTTVSHIIEESIEKAEMPEHVSHTMFFQEENQKLKERLELVETAIDDIIFGGGF
jgi:hypothetical protein